MRICSKCLAVIDGAAIVSEGKYFHPEHFCCHRCKQPVVLEFHMYKKWRLCSRCLPRPMCSSLQCSEPDRSIGYASGQFYRLPANNRLNAFHGCHTVRCGVCGRGLFCCSGPADALAYHLNEGRLICTRCYYNLDGFRLWARGPGKILRRTKTPCPKQLDKRRRPSLREARKDQSAFRKLAAEQEKARIKEELLMLPIDKMKAKLATANMWKQSTVDSPVFMPPPSLLHGPPRVVQPTPAPSPASSLPIQSDAPPTTAPQPFSQSDQPPQSMGPYEADALNQPKKSTKERWREWRDSSSSVTSSKSESQWPPPEQSSGSAARPRNSRLSRKPTSEWPKKSQYSKEPRDSVKSWHSEDSEDSWPPPEMNAKDPEANQGSSLHIKSSKQLQDSWPSRE